MSSRARGSLPDLSFLQDLSEREIPFRLELRNIADRWYALERSGPEKSPVSISWGEPGKLGNRANPKTCSLEHGWGLVSERRNRGWRFHRTNSGVWRPARPLEGTQVLVPFWKWRGNRGPTAPLASWAEPFCRVWDLRRGRDGIWDALGERGELIVRVPEDTAQTLLLDIFLAQGEVSPGTRET